MAVAFRIVADEVVGRQDTATTGVDAALHPAASDRPAEPDAVSGPITSSLAVATWALFVGLGVMLVGVGMFATLIAVRSELDGFGSLAIGLVGAAYFGGFIAGSRGALLVLGRVGHIRVYAALAALLAATILLSGLQPGPVSWIILRFVAGACLAGQYVVAESWLNQLVTNQARGRILSIYTVTTVVAYGIGQFWFSRLDPNAITGFGLAAMLISLAVVPVTLSEEATPPVLAEPTAMSLRELWSTAPTGMITSILVGVAHGAFLGLGAVYATRSGLSIAKIGTFVAMPTIGSLFLSVPVTALSDGRDRRLVGAGAATVAASAAALLWSAGADDWRGFVAMFVIGGMTYPLYSITGAYTNDWVPAEKLTAVAGQLVLLFGVGAFTGPIIGSFVMAAAGAEGFAIMAVAAHGAIALFLIARAIQYPSSVRAKPWNEVPVAARLLYLPATAVATGRRLRPQRRRPVRHR
jgi:MFS family permease